MLHDISEKSASSYRSPLLHAFVLFSYSYIYLFIFYLHKKQTLQSNFCLKKFQ